MFSVLTTILAYFLPSPHPEQTSLVWPLLVGFVVGYMLWPALQAAQHPPGYLQPTSARILKALFGAGLGTALLAYFQYVILDDGLNIEGWLVAFLYIAALAYLNLGGAPRLPFWHTLGWRQSRER